MKTWKLLCRKWKNFQQLNACYCKKNTVILELPLKLHFRHSIYKTLKVKVFKLSENLHLNWFFILLIYSRNFIVIFLFRLILISINLVDSVVPPTPPPLPTKNLYHLNGYQSGKLIESDKKKTKKNYWMKSRSVTYKIDLSFIFT